MTAGKERKMDAELRPCPFCGGTKIELSEGTTFRWRYVGCTECGAQMEFRSDNRFEPTAETWADAAEAWNPRSLLPSESGAGYDYHRCGLNGKPVWLVERPGPEWLSVIAKGVPLWTKDPMQACRWDTEKGAKGAISIRWEGFQEAKPTEHIFATALQPARPEVVSGNSPNVNREMLRDLIEFAYKQGYHEHGFNLLAEFEEQASSSSLRLALERLATVERERDEFKERLSCELCEKVLTETFPNGGYITPVCVDCYNKVAVKVYQQEQRAESAEQAMDTLRLDARHSRDMSQKYKERAEELEGRMREVEKAAARYRWLNEQLDFLAYVNHPGGQKTYRLKCGEALDNWIDGRIEEEAAAAPHPAGGGKG